ncbi:MAG: hypothetical protein AAGF47_10145 [Planctomycetota bacterium]
MHIITKILVVFAAVLSLALAALTSVYALNADSFVSALSDKVAEADAANALYETQSSQFAEQASRMESQLRGRDETIADLNSDLARLEGELTTLEIRAKEATDSAAQVKRQIGDLGKTTDTQAAIVETLTSEVRALREQNLNIREQNIDLLARLNDIETENEILNQTKRALEVTIADLQAQIDGTASTTLAGGPSGTPTAISGPPVIGRVSAVREVNGQRFAEINLGSRDRVRQNSKLFITREDRWLADLVIVQTDIQSAVGRVDVLGRNGVEVREGDVVLSSLGG